MDVHRLGEGRGFLVAGQVVLSQPGSPCLRCLGIVTDQALEDEARAYGAAGSKPQVVWPNGLLASSAVGLVIALVTPWHQRSKLGAYLSYDGNTGTVSEGMRFTRLTAIECLHYPPSAVGEAGFDIRSLAGQEKHNVSARESMPARLLAALMRIWRR